MITGIDLVAWQLRVAAGEPLPLSQPDVTCRGHAIEARLCAEDTHGDFLPQAGTLLAFEPPVTDGVRVDHGLDAGTAVSPYYDPMIAKLIAHGASREEARRRLISALTDLVVLGVETNRGFLIDCLNDEAFRKGEVSTAFIATRFPADRRKRRAPGGDMMALAAVLIDRQAQVAVDEPLRHFRNAGAESSPLVLRCAERKTAMELVRLDSGSHRVAWQDESHEIGIIAIAENRVRFLADGLQQTAHFAFDRDALHLTLDGLTAAFTDVLLARPDAGESNPGAAALAPMTGTIAAVHVKSGDSVKKGQCLMILEAMKMQHEIVAPRDGTIAAVLVGVGQQVTTRKILVELAQ
jgi:geranyl-CoA carboxylase alpha subunit